MLNREAISSMLPHGGIMVLLDWVEDWTEKTIECRTGSHRKIDNPLRRASGLSSLSGIEYGAQAMAVHGALISGDRERPGVLAALRDVRCHVDRLDEIEGDLTVRASLLHGERQGFIYTFSIHANTVELLRGRATVVLK